MKTLHLRTFILVLSVTLMAAILMLGQAMLPQASAAQAAGIAASNESAAARTITVVGNGVASAKPDLVQLTVGVESIASSLKEATTDSSTTIKAITKALIDHGVAPADIKAWDYGVWSEIGSIPDNEAEAVATFHVTKTVAVTLRSPDKVDAVLSAVADAGANTISNVSYDVEDKAAVATKARETAMAAAKQEAVELAALARVQLGDVVSISEVIGDADAFSGYTMSSPSQVEMSLNLQVTFAID
mgnify:FL=1